MKSDYDDLIRQAAAKYLPGYDWRLIKAQLWQESRLNPLAVSPAGAQGIAQFKPLTWAEWSPRAGYAGKSAFDPRPAIFTAAMYMAYLIKEWDWPRPEIDRTCLAMASYNAGLGSLLDAQQRSDKAVLYVDIIRALPAVTGRHAKETTDYVSLILGFWCDQVVGHG